MSRTLRRLIPSPAMIVALVALVMSLGGSAYALMITGRSIKNNSVTGKDLRHNTVIGKDIRKRSLRGHDLRANSVGGGAIKESALERYWAVVEQNGGRNRGEGLAAVDPTVRLSDGLYRVTFDRDVRDCSYQATIGSPDHVVPVKDSQVTVSRDPNNFNAVRVRTATGPIMASGTNTAADRPFQLAVSC
jgi:hypothetical protein